MIKGWIKLTVLCESKESVQLKELNISVKDDNYYWREDMFQISAISSISLEPVENGNTIIYSHGMFAEVKENYTEICKLIELNS